MLDQNSALSFSGRLAVEVNGTALVAGSVRAADAPGGGGGGTTTGASHLHIFAEALDLLPGAQLVADRVTLVSSGAVNISGKAAATYIPLCAVAQRRELCRDITGSREALPVLRPTPWRRPSAVDPLKNYSLAIIVLPGFSDGFGRRRRTRQSKSWSKRSSRRIIRVVRSCRRGRRRRQLQLRRGPGRAKTPRT